MDETLIAELGIQEFTAEQQERIIQQYQLEIGEEVTNSLSIEQLGEYQQIIDGNDELIRTWLQDNEPNYRESVGYQELEDETEGVPADKVYASVAWIQHNVSNIDTIVATAKARVKENPAQYVGA